MSGAGSRGVVGGTGFPRFFVNWTILRIFAKTIITEGGVLMEIEDIREIAKAGRRREAVEELTKMLEEEGCDRETVLLELGVVYNAMADMTNALNCLNEVLRINPENTRAKTYVDMINSILNYYCKDLLNP